MNWEKSENNSKTEYFASDETTAANDRNVCVDEFLDYAFQRIGENYDYQQCPAVIIDVWPEGGLRVFDSPSGFELTHTEKVWCQLIHTQFAKYSWSSTRAVSEEYGDDSPQFDEVCEKMYKISWDSIAASVKSGSSKRVLAKFESQPTPIIIFEGFDGLAHNIVSGERISMVGNEIEKQKQQVCECKYCTARS